MSANRELVMLADVLAREKNVPRDIVFGALGLVLVKRMGRESATMRGGGWDDLLFTIREGIARPFRRARRATVQQQPVTG